MKKLISITILAIIFTLFVEFRRAYAFNLDLDDINNRKDIFANKLKEETYLEAKYFFLLRLFQNTDTALGNLSLMPFVFSRVMGFDSSKRGLPRPVKNVLLGAFASAAHYDGLRIGIGLLNNDAENFDGPQQKFFKPNISFKWLNNKNVVVASGFKANVNWGENFRKGRKFPIEPAVFTRIDLKAIMLSMEFSYEKFGREAKFSIKYTGLNKNLLFKSDITYDISRPKKPHELFVDTLYHLGGIKIPIFGQYNVYMGPTADFRFYDKKPIAVLFSIYGFKK